MSADLVRPRAPWQQFRLRSLLFIISVIGIACGLLVREFQRSDAVVQINEVLSAGGLTVNMEPGWVEVLPGRCLFVHLRGVQAYGDRQWATLQQDPPRCRGFGVRQTTVNLADLVAVSHKTNGKIISLGKVQLSVESSEPQRPNWRVSELRYSEMKLTRESLQHLKTVFPNAEIFEY